MGTLNDYITRLVNLKEILHIHTTVTIKITKAWSQYSGRQDRKLEIIIRNIGSQ